MSPLTPGSDRHTDAAAYTPRRRRDLTDRIVLNAHRIEDYRETGEHVTTALDYCKQIEADVAELRQLLEGE